MPIQYEIPILASLGAPKDEPTAWVHATSFEECVRLAFERGRKRYDPENITAEEYRAMLDRELA